MAIDLSQINILGDVSKDLKRMLDSTEFYEKVVKQAAEIHVEDAKEKTKSSISPSGSPYAELKDSYKKKKKSVSDEDDIANLRYGYDSHTRRRKPKAMDNILIAESDQNRSSKVYFDPVADNAPRKNGDRMTAAKYMGYHQDGERGNEQRKVFPTEEDMGTTAQKENKGKVGKTLQTYLMTPRTITVTLRGQKRNP
jgi:hypothetical protein